MSYEFWSSKNVKARKPYRCCECSAAIAVGELHNYGAGKFDGYLVDQRLCLNCDLIISEGFNADFWDDEGFPLTEVRSTLRDEHGIDDAHAWAVERRQARIAKREDEAAATARATRAANEYRP